MTNEKVPFKKVSLEHKSYYVVELPTLPPKKEVWQWININNTIGYWLVPGVQELYSRENAKPIRKVRL